MQPWKRDPARNGFTLVELLLVVGILALLMTLLLPTVSKARQRSHIAKCANNLRQVGLAFQLFADEHQTKFPMQTSTTQGGTMEFIRAATEVSGNFYFAFRHFQAISNQLINPALLICPTDTRPVAPDFLQLRNDNISYFAGIDADPAQPTSVLSGDSNLAGEYPSSAPVQRFSSDARARWTTGLHGPRGNLLFGDGHVDQGILSRGLSKVMAQSPAHADTLWLPIRAPQR